MEGTKEVDRLDWDTPASEGIRLLLTNGFIDMSLIRSAASDPMFTRFRELRFAVRRFIYTLDGCKPYLGNDLPADFHHEMEEIMNALGNIIDEDGLIKMVLKVQPVAPAEYATGIARLLEERRLHRQNLVAALSPLLGEQHIIALRNERDKVLDQALRKATPKSLLEVLRENVLLCLGEMQTSSVNLYRPSKPRASHRLRISVRKLRYALELLSLCVGRAALDFQADLGGLQTRLGKLRNLDRNVNLLGDWLTDHQQRMTGSKDILPEWNAVVWLLGHLFERRPNQFRKALAVGEELLTSGFAPRLARYCQELDLNHKWMFKPVTLRGSAASPGCGRAKLFPEAAHPERLVVD